MKEKKLAILAKYGVSLPQYRVMDSVYTGPFGMYEPEYLAYYTTRLLEGSNLQYRTEDYREAIAECLEKGWLRHLSTPLPDALLMLHESQVPVVRMETGPARGIGFTIDGYKLHRQIRMENFGIDHVQYSDSGWVINDEAQRVEIFAEKKVHCDLRLNEFLSNLPGHLGREATVEQTEGPSATGAWRPDPFLTIPTGFKAVIKFKPLEPQNS
jgi:hypothetical protein